MEQQDENKKFILLDKRGKIVCLVVGNEIEYKNFNEIEDKNTIFTFWSNSIEELKDFINAFEAFKSINPFKNLSLDEISFLEMKIEEDGSVVFS